MSLIQQRSENQQIEKNVASPLLVYLTCSIFGIIGVKRTRRVTGEDMRFINIEISTQCQSNIIISTCCFRGKTCAEHFRANIKKCSFFRCSKKFLSKDSTFKLTTTFQTKGKLKVTRRILVASTSQCRGVT